MEDYKEALRFIDRNCTAWGKENQDEFIKAKHILDKFIDEYENVLRDNYVISNALDEACRLYNDVLHTTIGKSPLHYENSGLSPEELRVKFLLKSHDKK